MARERDTEQTLSPRPDSPGVAEFAGLARTERVRGGEVDSGFAPIAPRVAGEIVDAALDLLIKHFAMLVGLCALLSLPVRILQPVLGIQPWDQGTDVDAMLGQLVGTAIVGISGAIVQSFVNAVVTTLVFHSAQGRPLRVSDALLRTLRRFPGLLVIALLTGIAGMFGMVLCIVPYFLVVWKLSLASSVYVIEDVSISEALQRSFTLSVGSFLRWAAIMVVTAVFVLPYSGLVGAFDHPLVLGWLHEQLPIDPTILSVALVVLTSLFMGIVGAVSGVVTTVFYVDCLVRREGLDLRARVATIAPASGAST